MRKFKQHFGRKLVIIGAVMIGLLLYGPAPQADAGLWDWVTGISEVPSEVETLKSNYEQMQQSLVETQQNYQDMTSRLNMENAELQQKNEQLTERILMLEEQEVKQKLRTNRILTTAIAAALLLVLYFLLTRLLRVLVWRRHSRN